MNSGTHSAVVASSAPVTSATQLAISVLFGDEVASRLDPSLVASLAGQPRAWAQALQAIWTISGGPGSVGVPAPGAWASGALGQSNGAGYGHGHEATAAEDAPAAPPALSPAPVSELDLFDPAANGQGTGQDRAAPWSYGEVRDEFVAILEEITGYPAEVLDDDADLESDLAIDSVKQVEALARLREHHELTLEDNFSIRDYRTIRISTTYLVNRLNSERGQLAASR
jgi:hypothetical protein